MKKAVYNCYNISDNRMFCNIKHVKKIQIKKKSMMSLLINNKKVQDEFNTLALAVLGKDSA